MFFHFILVRTNRNFNAQLLKKKSIIVYTPTNSNNTVSFFLPSQNCYLIQDIHMSILRIDVHLLLFIVEHGESK